MGCTKGVITPRLTKYIQLGLDSWKKYDVRSAEVNHTVRI